MTQDSWDILLGLLVAFAFPLTVIGSIVGLLVFGWIIYTVFVMAKPVWIVLYVVFRIFLYMTVWFFVLSGLCWLFGLTGPIHFFADIYSAIPGKLYNFLTR